MNTRINDQLGPPGAGQEIPKGPNECVYCEREALAPGYSQPSMCEQHLVISVIVQYLRNHGLPINVETVSLFVTEHPQADIHLNEVETLLAPILEAAHVTG